MCIMKNIINYFIFLCCILLISSCKQKSKEETSEKELSTSISDTISQKEQLSCEEWLTKVMRSSNFIPLAEVSIADCYLYIDEAELDNITMCVYLPTDGDSKTMPIGWLQLNVTEKKLYDIFSDPDNPKELKFNTSLLDQYDFETFCGVSSQIEEKVNEKRKNCKDIANHHNFTFTTICEYPKVINFTALYDSLRAVEKDQNLLKKLPKKDTLFTKNKSIEIKYRLYKDSITVNMLWIESAGSIDYKIYKEGNKGVTLTINAPD